MRQIQQSFVVLSQNGINPDDFVDWYISDGFDKQNQGLLFEATEQWLENNPSDFSSNGPGVNPTANPQQHLASASQAINNLSKRLAKSKALKEKLGNNYAQLAQAVAALINMLNDPSKMQPQQQPPQQPQPQPQPQQPQQPAQPQQQSPVSTPSESAGFSNFANRLKLKNEIKSDLLILQKEYNIHPVAFIEWYVEEGRHLNEGWFDGVKDWFGQLGSNVKDAWGRVRNSWGQAGQQYQAGVDKKRDDDAIQQALAAIDQLDQSVQGRPASQDFLNVLQQVKAGLQTLNAAPEPAAPATATPPSDEDWMNSVHGGSQPGSAHEGKIQRVPLFSEYLKRRS